MWYDEKIIDGVLCFQTKPNGEWKPYTNVQLKQLLISLRQRVEQIQNLEVIR